MLEKIFGKFPEVILMLRHDHKLVNKLFAQYAEADHHGKAGIARRTMQALEMHTALEEKVVYPAFRKAFEDKAMIDEAIQEHHLVHVLLRELKTLKPGHATFDAKFAVLRELIRHHVDEEECHMFPKAEAQDLDWNALYKNAQSVKGQLSKKFTKRSSAPPRARAA